MISSDNQNLLVLTNAVPYADYNLIDGHILRAVKASDEMFKGFSIAIPHGYFAIMSVAYLNNGSYDVWRDIIMFHSFICDDPETYDYSERMIQKWWGDSELEFIRETRLGRENTVSRDNRRYKRWRGIDFDRFPIIVYPTAKESLDAPPTTQANANIEKHGMTFKEIEAEYEVLLSYRDAFKSFRSLKSSDKKLFDQMRLYVFAKSLRKFSEVYRNDHCSVALYISILESLAGRPENCTEQPKCSECGKTLSHVHGSIDKHLVEIYGKGFKSLRKIRHKFFHESDYRDIVDMLYEGYDEKGENPDKYKEAIDEASDFEDEIEWLEKITRKSLLEAFMNRCGVPNPS